MSSKGVGGQAAVGIDISELREAISEEYAAVANEPDQGFHFHTGRRLTNILGYDDEWLVGISESAIESFAGTGNPFRMGEIGEGENVVDLGSGAGIDSLIAAKMVGPDGNVVGIDMTDEMLDKARKAGEESGIDNAEFKKAHIEDLPIKDGWADVVISNGVLNLSPDKQKTFSEIARILKPGGRIQIGDILVQREVPEGAKQKIDLWTG